MRVVIAEDSVLLREGLTRLLIEAGFEVVAAAGDAETFLRAVDAQRPTWWWSTSGCRRPSPTRGLRAALVVRRAVARRSACWSSPSTSRSGTPPSCWPSTAGGVGYLLKDRVADVGDFIDALRRVAGGGSVLDPEVVAQLLARSRSPLAALTPREQRVLGLMAEGRSNAGIATTLSIGTAAVEKYVNSIFSKLELAPADSDHRRVLAVLRYLGN